MQIAKTKDLQKVMQRADFGGLISLNVNARLNEKDANKQMQSNHGTPRASMYQKKELHENLLEVKDIMATQIIEPNFQSQHPESTCSINTHHFDDIEFDINQAIDSNEKKLINYQNMIGKTVEEM